MKCIKIMNEKLPLCIRIMKDEKMGYFPFVYGDDVNARMNDE